MNPFVIYTACWSLCTLTAIILLIRKKYFKNNLIRYCRFLFEPWKIITFIIAALSITLAAPYSGDPTWDYIDGAFIPVLTFITAPWAVGAVFRSFKLKSNWSDIYIAVCLILFSSSWSYDSYILLRDGVYPDSWLPNLIISPNLYIAGGLFWNLEHNIDKGIKFSFQRDTWYQETCKTSFLKLFWMALPLMAFAVYGVAWFVLTT